MRKETCGTCGVTFPLGSMFLFNDRTTHCESCIAKVVEEARAAKRPDAFYSLLDATICSKCQMDYGQTELSRVGGRPMCFRCEETARAWPYPQWFRLSFGGLALLLVLGLFYERSYFEAGRNLYRGERLMEAQNYTAAIPPLKAAAAVAPNSDKAVLLLAKAYFVTGDANGAWEVINKHNDGSFGDGESAMFGEVRALADRADRAFRAAQDAAKLLEQAGKSEEAARKMHEAVALYPESQYLAGLTPHFDIGVAFENKDYDRFLALAEEMVKKEPDSPEAISQVASAMACKYVVTGDASWREKSEGLLEKARALSSQSPESKERFDEYAERIEHRLRTREIIDSDEYNRRYRGKEGGKSQ